MLKAIPCTLSQQECVAPFQEITCCQYIQLCIALKRSRRHRNLALQNQALDKRYNQLFGAYGELYLAYTEVMNYDAQAVDPASRPSKPTAPTPTLGAYSLIYSNKNKSTTLNGNPSAGYELQVPSVDELVPAKHFENYYQRFNPSSNKKFIFKYAADLQEKMKIDELAKEQAKKTEESGVGAPDQPNADTLSAMEDSGSENAEEKPITKVNSK